jgi:hypothetical protein
VISGQSIFVIRKDGRKLSGMCSIQYRCEAWSLQDGTANTFIHKDEALGDLIAMQLCRGKAGLFLATDRGLFRSSLERRAYNAASVGWSGIWNPSGFE